MMKKINGIGIDSHDSHPKTGKVICRIMKNCGIFKKMKKNSFK